MNISPVLYGYGTRNVGFSGVTDSSGNLDDTKKLEKLAEILSKIFPKEKRESFKNNFINCFTSIKESLRNHKTIDKAVDALKISPETKQKAKEAIPKMIEYARNDKVGTGLTSLGSVAVFLSNMYSTSSFSQGTLDSAMFFALAACILYNTRNTDKQH